MPTIQEMKERTVLETPVLLFDCELRDGTRQRWSTHQVSFGGLGYGATLLDHTGFDIKAYSEDGIDASAKVTVTLANADSRYSQMERSIGFKGSRLTVQFAFFDLATGEAASDAVTLFRGIGNSPDFIKESAIRLTFNNRLNFQRVFLPDIRIQKRCPWLFPSTSEQRQEGMTGGFRAAYSPFFRCGYSAGEIDGIGNLNNGAPYTSCDYTRKSCEERGMFKLDSSGRMAHRFGGVEFVPSSVLVRGYGEKVSQNSAVLANEAKYNDFVPLVYGMCWVQPPVTLARNDGNLTRMEVLLSVGEINGVVKVIVNDVEIPQAVDGRNMTATGWYHLVSSGNRTGNFNLNFTDASGQPLGDPYGSMAYLSIVVPNRIQDGRSLPRVQVLMQGLKLPTYDTAGEFVADTFTNNPVWVLLDVLRRSGWTVEEIDLGSFGETALYCDDPVETFDLHGSPISISRFQCNLALRRRRSAADVVRGIRNCAGLYLTFGNGGKLQLRQETTIGVQQTQRPSGSNAEEQLGGGWPAYEFDEGSILRGGNGEPRLRISSRNSADTPNRFSVEFQDAFNEYQQDSISLLDIDDVVASGQETTGALPALGLANFDQATRMTKLHLLKSVRGNVYVEFETSVKAIGLKPGDLITLTYEKEGFLRQMFRVQRITPGLNFRTVSVTAQWHEDDWYVQTAGRGAESSGRQPKYELGLPRPLTGNVLDEDGVPQFEVSETYIEETDGSAKVRLTAGFTEPLRPGSSRAGIPLLALSPMSQAGGGTLEGDQILYYAVTGVDSEGQEGGLSFIVRAVLPPGSSTNLVTLQNLSFGEHTTAFHVYRGPSPQQLARIASDEPLVAAFVDTGFEEGLRPPPDENYSHANFYWRLELQPAMPATVYSASSIGNGTLNMLPNEWRGKMVRIVRGKGAAQERKIVSSTATECQLTEQWDVIPDASSMWVVVEPSWVFASTTASSPATFEIPNREGATVQIQGLAANANDKECLPNISPLTRWRILGAAGQYLDENVPPKPTFGLSTLGDGMLEIQSIGFETLANTRGVSAGTLVLHYWDELQSPTTVALTADVDADATVIPVTSTGGVSVGQIVQIDGELMEVLAISAGETALEVLRASHSSNADAHANGIALYPLDRKAFILAFSRDFFGSAASGSYAHSIHLPNVRAACAELYMTNAQGNSEVSKRHVAGTSEGGLRTLQGGQMNLQVEGWLAIEDDAAPPLVIESATAIRDIFAVVQEAPTIGPVRLRIRQDEETVCELEIPPGQAISNVVEGFGLPPLRAEAVLHLDILSVAQTAASTPGSDLTVTIRL